jgi:hypothetical protein
LKLKYYFKLKKRVFDSDYQRRFAIALVLSLLATITVFGGALFAFEYWKKKRYNGGESSGNVSGAANRVYIFKKSRKKIL